MSITFSLMMKRREEMWVLVGGAMGGCVERCFLLVMCRMGGWASGALIVLSSE